jgi:hypothetical protein
MTNIGSRERVARIIVGVSLASFLIFENTFWAILGLVPFLTGVIGYCPLYALLGINKVKHAS